MPRVRSGPNKGLIPDMLVNPHSIPSRMPMGEQDEMHSSKAALYNGTIIDSTTFNHFNPDDHSRVLRDAWVNYIQKHPEENNEEDGKLFHLGYEDMEVPVRRIPEDKKDLRQGPRHLVATGEYRKCRKPIFLGPCYTQALKHHVLDKFQIRSVGTIDPKTHQPVSGRSREGGLRFGEMERDALISHGATAILLERMMKVSDEFEAIICVDCGNFVVANFKTDNVYCNVCDTREGVEGKEGNYGLITFPYVFKYLIQLLQLAMISVTFKVVKTTSFGTGKGILEDRYVT